ncbi:hypothetical protein ALC56_04392, partial [Trachymyrmex septentrionalis]
KRNFNGRWSRINERYTIIRVRKSRSDPNSLLEEVPTLNHLEESTGVTARDSRPVPRLALRIDLHSLHGVLANPLDVPSTFPKRYAEKYAHRQIPLLEEKSQRGFGRRYAASSSSFLRGYLKRRRERERERERERGKQEKQGPTSLFRGGCCGINSVKSRRADRASETERDRGRRGESS